MQFETKYGELPLLGYLKLFRSFIKKFDMSTCIWDSEFWTVDISNWYWCFNDLFLARDVIYTSHAYATMSVSICLSVYLWRKCIGAL